MRSFVLLGLLAVAACAPDSQGGVNAAIQSGALHISRGSGSYDYVVTFPVMRDFGFTTERRSDRVKFVRAALSQECADPVIAKEDAIKSGHLIDGPDYLYTEYVRCK